MNRIVYGNVLSFIVFFILYKRVYLVWSLECQRRTLSHCHGELSLVVDAPRRGGSLHTTPGNSSSRGTQGIQEDSSQPSCSYHLSEFQSQGKRVACFQGPISPSYEQLLLVPVKNPTTRSSSLLSITVSLLVSTSSLTVVRLRFIFIGCFEIKVGPSRISFESESTPPGSLSSLTW